MGIEEGVFFIGVKIYEAIKSILFIVSLIFHAYCVMNILGYS